MGSESEAQVFATAAIREKMSTSIRFPDIPIYINAIYRAYGPPGPATMHLMAIVPERLSFRCSGCGDLDADSLMREYTPRRYSMEEISQKTTCPFCGKSERVLLVYDPNLNSPSPVPQQTRKPWWKFW